MEYSKLVIILWTVFGPNIPEELYNSKDIHVLHSLKKYSDEFKKSAFILHDGLQKANIDSKLLFKFSMMRKLVNEEGFKEKNDHDQRVG